MKELTLKETTEITRTELEQIGEAYIWLHKVCKGVERRLKRMKAYIETAMIDRGINALTLKSGVLMFESRKYFDQTKFAKGHPELYEAYLVETRPYLKIYKTKKNT